MAKQARGGKPSGNSDGAGRRKAASDGGSKAAAGPAAPAATPAAGPAAAKAPAAKAAAKPAKAGAAGKAKAPAKLETGSPGWLGAIAAAVLGVVLLGFGGYALIERNATLRPLSVALILVGAAQIALCVRAIFRSRPAWSFLMSINGTMFVVFLFGSPKLRDEFQTPLLVALIPCVLFAVTTVLLSLSARDFERR
jgi:hypothetical protein